jgi:hypothetical protein
MGKNGNDYLVSDPVFEVPVICPVKTYESPFFRRRTAPKGTMFCLSDVPEKVDFLAVIREGIKEVCHVMIHFHYYYRCGGYQGICEALRQWPEKYGKRKVLSILVTPSGCRRKSVPERRIPSHVCRISSGSSAYHRRQSIAGDIKKNDGNWRQMAGVALTVRGSARTEPQMKILLTI